MKLKTDDFQLLEENTLFHCDIFEVVKSKFKLPTGNIADFHYVNGREVVAGVVVTPENNIILTREFRPSQKKVMLNLPGGGAKAANEQERVEELNRELQEEIGMKGKRIEKLFTGTPWVHRGRKFHLYLVRDLEESKLEPDQDELIEVAIFPIKKAIELILSGKEECDFPCLLGLLLAKEKLKL